MPKATIDISAFYAALDRRRQEEGLSWRALGRELDIPASTFTRLSNGGGPDVDAFAVLIHWLRMPVAVFLVPPVDDVDPDTLPKTTVDAIGEQLRGDVDLAPDAAEAIERLIRVAYDTLRTTQPHKSRRSRRNTSGLRGKDPCQDD